MFHWFLTRSTPQPIPRRGVHAIHLRRLLQLDFAATRVGSTLSTKIVMKCQSSQAFLGNTVKIRYLYLISSRSGKQHCVFSGCPNNISGADCFSDSLQSSATFFIMTGLLHVHHVSCLATPPAIYTPHVWAVKPAAFQKHSQNVCHAECSLSVCVKKSTGGCPEMLNQQFCFRKCI